MTVVGLAETNLKTTMIDWTIHWWWPIKNRRKYWQWRNLIDKPIRFNKHCQLNLIWVAVERKTRWLWLSFVITSSLLEAWQQQSDCGTGPTHIGVNVWYIKKEIFCTGKWHREKYCSRHNITRFVSMFFIPHSIWYVCRIWMMTIVMIGVDDDATYNVGVIFSVIGVTAAALVLCSGWLTLHIFYIYLFKRRTCIENTCMRVLSGSWT